MKLLEVKELVKHFPIYTGLFRHQTGAVKAVDGVSFEVASGEVVGMVGESGCGKSTVGRCILRLIEPTSGSILFEGKELTTLPQKDLRALRADAQIVFQDPFSSLNPRRMVWEAIGDPLWYHGRAKTRDELKEQVAEIMRQVGLNPDTMDRYPHEFSGGQQQRLCIGRAIALKPKLIVCDEAVSALDISIQAQILILLKELKDTLNLSYLFISHDLSVVRYLCDRVLVIYNGKLVESGATEELFNDPKHPYTKELLQAIPCRHPKFRTVGR